MTDLFSYQPPHVKGSKTSKAAADSMVKSGKDLCARIMVLFRDVGAQGMTCDEVEEAMELRHQTASARIVELVDDGSLTKTDRTRKTRSGRAAAVYIASVK